MDAEETKKETEQKDHKSEENITNLERRRFIGGAGAAGLLAVTATTGLLNPANVKALERIHARPDGRFTPRYAGDLHHYPKYKGAWNKIHERPFGGFDVAIGYIAEGIDTMDPKQPNPNPVGLFESNNPAIPSGVGGNETEDRSAEYWFRDILHWSNETITNDVWSFINYARRRWGLDFDNPLVDGYTMPDGSSFSYGGSPNPDDEISLFSPRIAIDGKGGVARMASTLLAPSFGYTVVFRSGRSNPNYVGGTTGREPEDPAKVRDGGIWGGVLKSLDVLQTIQDAAAGNLTYTTPYGPSSNPAQWGQFWRSIAHVDNLDIDAADANQAIGNRPQLRPNWPLGYLSEGTDFFWGNYNLNFGKHDLVTLHYESIMPTRFRDTDGIPEAFICELMAHPGGTDMPHSQIESGFKDIDGSMSGFPDLSDPNLNGQNPFGLGRVHGTAVPEGKTRDGLTTYHLRNWLLFPPTLNSVVTINDTVPGKGVLDNTAPEPERDDDSDDDSLA